MFTRLQCVRTPPWEFPRAMREVLYCFANSFAIMVNEWTLTGEGLLFGAVWILMHAGASIQGRVHRSRSKLSGGTVSGHLNVTRAWADWLSLSINKRMADTDPSGNPLMRAILDAMEIVQKQRKKQALVFDCAIFFFSLLKNLHCRL